MKSIHKQVASFLRWASIFILMFATLISNGKGFEQELWLYDADDNSLYFNSSQTDLSNYSSFLENVTQACTYGVWTTFNTTNFQKYKIWLGSPATAGLQCQNYNLSEIKSLRHWGARDTSIDALSLYSGTYYDGDELFVTEPVYTNNTHTIITMTATGISNWMLFEGAALDGKSRCYEVPYSITGRHYFNWDRITDLGLTTIGSVFKGCDLEQIQSYKNNLVE